MKIIEPMPGVEVADVVWNELYDELLEEMHKREKIKWNVMGLWIIAGGIDPYCHTYNTGLYL